jgi:glycosyltransferase involved in cell wall biosynthesis
MKPTVSIVVPYLDQERYLAQAIESVLAQTLSEWELLLVDDGSRDQGPRIAAAYAAAHP